MIKPKTILLELESGTAGKTLRIVEKPLGSGKQGTVYRKPGRGKSQAQAVKIFHQRNQKTEEAIIHLISAKFPKDVPIFKPKKYFYTKDGRFGYVMDLLGDGFVEYKDLIKQMDQKGDQAEDVPNLSILCRIGYGLAEIIHCIHEKGWLFPDLSENNFAFHPKTGQVVLFDSDNLRKAEEVEKGNVAIRGTYGSMAPELVRGACYPNRYTDNFSLASVIFQMFMHHYPYDGRAMLEEINDEDYYQRYHGTDPVFAFSDKRRSRVLPNAGYYREKWKRWKNLFPQNLKEMFFQAFEQGIEHPEQRPEPKEWMYLFHKLSRDVIYCPECKHEMFAKDYFCECPSCGKISWIPRMQIESRKNCCKLPIFKNQEICPFQIEVPFGENVNFSFHSAILPIAKLVEDRKLPYLVNLDARGERWSCSYEKIVQIMEYGDGNLFADNVCIRIPVKDGKWIITIKEEDIDADEKLLDEMIKNRGEIQI